MEVCYIQELSYWTPQSLSVRLDVDIEFANELIQVDQPAEQPADTQPQEPEAPAEGETGGSDAAGEAPSISLPTQEEVEQAASSIYNAASSIWGALQDAASQQNDAA